MNSYRATVVNTNGFVTYYVDANSSDEARKSLEKDGYEVVLVVLMWAAEK